MNLLNTTLELNENNIFNFRKYQYSLLSYHINNMFSHLNKFGMDIDIDNIKIKRIEPIYYHGINESKLHHIKIYNSNDDLLLDFFYPKLYHDTFFKLNGVNYIPSIYCSDEPIVIKKQTVTLNSLFFPIVIELKKKSQTIINRKRYNTSDFLRIFFDDKMTRNLCHKFDFDYLNKTDENISELFQLGKKKQNNEKVINDLFFDAHTKELYGKYYNLEDVDFKNILIQMFLNLTKEKPSFIDLTHKRLTLIENLLFPIFQSAKFIIINKLLNDEKVNKIYLKSPSILCKHFINNMYRKNPYDVYNSFTTLLSYKFSFKTSLKTNNTTVQFLPSEISGIHETYQNKICPISISNTQIGENNHFVPDLELKDLKFGLLY